MINTVINWALKERSHLIWRWELRGGFINEGTDLWDDLKKRKHLGIEGAANSNSVLQLRKHISHQVQQLIYVVTGMIWKPKKKQTQQRIRKYSNMSGKYRIMSRRIEKNKGATFMGYEYYMLGNQNGKVLTKYLLLLVLILLDCL